LAALDECVAKCDLKPRLQVKFKYAYSEESTGADTRRVTTDMTGNITLKLVSNQQGYQGTGQATYAHIESSTTKSAVCSSSYSEVNRGSLKMDVNAYFSVGNGVTGGCTQVNGTGPFSKSGPATPR